MHDPLRPSEHPSNKGEPPKMPADTPPKEKGDTFSLFLDWVGGIIMAGGLAGSGEQVLPLTALHDVSLRQQQSKEVVETAKKVCDDLEEVKKRLSLEFGKKAVAFISKCIDPMIFHARELINDLSREQPKEGSFSDLLAQAIESVELYSQFSDESRLKRKIVQDAQGFIRQSIEKDMEMVENYKQQAFDNSKSVDEERQEREKLVDRFLYPILAELKGMANSKVETDDLHAFFIWKTSVDDRRNALIELAFLTTDGIVKENGAKSTLEPEDELLEISDVDQKLQEYAYILSILSHLESQVAEYIGLLENLPQGDVETLLLIEQLLIDLKNDAFRFTSVPVDSIKIQNDFKLLRETIQKAETLVSERKHASQ